ncbi:hypothetical protein [Streptomyces sp. NPDC092295]|uniref:hypothetical protein n=1 Tax=Streptomyces sp. NPDC092295 TaxID=3366011 RepID=UPI0037F9D7A4
MQTLKLTYGRLSGIELEMRPLLFAGPHVDVNPTSIIEFDPESVLPLAVCVPTGLPLIVPNLPSVTFSALNPRELNQFKA